MTDSKPNDDSGNKSVTNRDALPDAGVAVDGKLICQNFPEHPDEEIEMVSAEVGVVCPECGRRAGGGHPLEIPYVDEEVVYDGE